MKTSTKLGVAGLGLYLVSTLLKKATAAAEKMRPAPISMDGYDAVAEALGCANGGSFDEESAFNDGLGGSFKKKFKKLKKIAVSKPLKTFKKVAIAKPMKALKKSSQIVKRDFTKATKPLVRDFRKGGKLMKKDFGNLAMILGKKPKKKRGPVGEIEYYDANDNRITEAQYNALMAAQNQSYQSPDIMPPSTEIDGEMFVPEMSSHDEDNVQPSFIPMAEEEPADDGTYFTNDYGWNGEETEPLPVLSFSDDAMQRGGWADGDVPYGGSNWWQPQEDAWAAQSLPRNIRDNTLDAFAMLQTDGDSIIMPEREASTPYSADEFAVYTEETDPTDPDGSGSMYGNAQPGVYAPGYFDGYDSDWSLEGLGAVVMKQGKSRLMLASRKALRPTHRSGYGYFIKNPKRGGSTPIMPILADKKGNIFARNGGSMHRLGCIDDLAGGPGLGCAMFGRDLKHTMSHDNESTDGLGAWSDFFKKAEKTSKKVATYTTPSGFAYSRLKKNPKLYKEYRKVAKQSMPYVMIVGGAVVSVASVGIASPAGAAMIAGGVASLGAQAYSDVKTDHAEKKLDKAIERDRLAAAMDSTNVINDTQHLQPSGGPAPGEIPGGDWAYEYPGDGIVADFLDLADSFASY